MSAKRKKFIVIICLSLFFGVMLCVLGYTRMRSLFNMMEVSSNGQAPIRSLRITLDKSQREQLFDQLRKFADKHIFEIQIDEINAASGMHFNVWMSRDDILIIASDVPKAPTKVRISFYDKNPSHPAHKETVNDLFSDLKSFISEIPSVTITEEK